MTPTPDQGMGKLEKEQWRQELTPEDRINIRENVFS